MESSEAAVRRMHRIASHLAATPQNSCTTSLASLVCSSSSSIQSSSRKDARLLFARQATHLPAYIKDFRECQVSNAGSISQGNGRKDSRLLFARQGSHAQTYFMRECLEYQVSFPSEIEGGTCKQLHSTLEEPDTLQKALPESNHLKDGASCLNAKPLFARRVNEGADKREAVEPVPKVLPTKDAKHNEFDWLPRMNIAESRVSYVVTVELPGVRADGIRVEVNEERLLVSGSRSLEGWTDNMNRSEKSFYHCKELSQGPFRAQWPMPKHINLDCVSAEFMDGFLRIVLPKSAP